MSEVKRYTFDEICESGDFNHEEEFVLHADYENLKAQLERAEEVLKSFISGSCFCGRSEWCFECSEDLRKNNTREYFKEKEQV